MTTFFVRAIVSANLLIFTYIKLYIKFFTGTGEGIIIRNIYHITNKGKYRTVVAH